MRKDWIEYPYKEFVTKISTSKKKLKQREYLDKGNYPIIDQGQDFIGGFTNDVSKVLDCELPVIVFGDHTKIVKFVSINFAPGADGTKVLQPKSFINPKLLKCFTEVLAIKIKDKGYARHYQHIEKENIFLIAKVEQKAIVAKIEQLFSALDNGIANLKKAQEQLKTYRQAVLKKAFEGELTGERPELIETTLGIYFDIIMGQSPKSKYYNKEGHGLPFFQGKREFKKLYAKVDTWTESYTKVVEKDSVLLSVRAPIGPVNLAPIKCAIGRGLAGIKCNNLEKSKFAFYLLQSLTQELKKKGTGTTFKAITKNSLFNINIKIPSKELEQNQIVQEIETRLSVCDNVEANIKEALKKAELLQQSILKKAFEGELLTEAELLKVRNDPEWQPAEKLLERIQTEKAKASKQKRKRR